MMESNFLLGKKGLILGVANDRSIAWGAIKACKRAGANIIATYADVMEKRARPLLEENDVLGYPCDVTSESSIDDLFKFVAKEFTELDFVVHSIAYADKAALHEKFIDTKLEWFLEAMQISCFSFISIMRRASALMTNGGAAVTYSFLGSNKVASKYNVMGTCKAALESSVRYLASDLGSSNIRVNAISVGAIRTISSFGIENFDKMLALAQITSPLGRTVTIDDAGNFTAFLVSDLAKNISGQIMCVDAGSSIIAAPPDQDLLDKWTGHVRNQK